MFILLIRFGLLYFSIYCRQVFGHIVIACWFFIDIPVQYLFMAPHCKKQCFQVCLWALVEKIQTKFSTVQLIDFTFYSVWELGHSNASIICNIYEISSFWSLIEQLFSHSRSSYSRSPPFQLLCLSFPIFCSYFPFLSHPLTMGESPVQKLSSITLNST